MLQIIKREGLYGSGGEYLPLFHMRLVLWIVPGYRQLVLQMNTHHG